MYFWAFPVFTPQLGIQTDSGAWVHRGGGGCCTGLGMVIGGHYLVKLASFCREGPSLELGAWGALWWLWGDVTASQRPPFL